MADFHAKLRARVSPTLLIGVVLASGFSLWSPISVASQRAIERGHGPSACIDHRISVLLSESTQDPPPAQSPYPGSVFDTVPMRPRYIHEDEGKLILAHKRWRVHYMSTVERESSRIRVWHGKIFDSKGRLIAGSLEGQGKSFLYVMDEAGNIYISSNLEAVARFHHSSFLGGKNVAAAGVLRIRNGEIVYLNNDSGHYWPPRFCLSQAMDQLRFDGADTGKIKVKDVTDTF